MELSYSLIGLQGLLRRTTDPVQRAKIEGLIADRTAKLKPIVDKLFDDRTNRAVVLRIGRRFFAGFSKTGRVTTAWSLAGARIFSLFNDEDITDVITKLEAKKYKPVAATIVVEDGRP